MAPSFLWLRNDLRILDQPLVSAGSSSIRAWIYVFDLRFLSRRAALPGGGDVRKASARRALFLLQSVRDISKRLREHLKADLIVRIGDPEVEIGRAATQLQWKSWE